MAWSWRFSFVKSAINKIDFRRGLSFVTNLFDLVHI